MPVQRHLVTVPVDLRQSIQVRRLVQTLAPPLYSVVRITSHLVERYSDKLVDCKVCQLEELGHHFISVTAVDTSTVTKLNLAAIC